MSRLRGPAHARPLPLPPRRHRTILTIAHYPHSSPYLPRPLEILPPQGLLAFPQPPPPLPSATPADPTSASTPVPAPVPPVPPAATPFPASAPHVSATVPYSALTPTPILALTPCLRASSLSRSRTPRRLRPHLRQPLVIPPHQRSGHRSTIPCFSSPRSSSTVDSPPHSRRVTGASRPRHPQTLQCGPTALFTACGRYSCYLAP